MTGDGLSRAVDETARPSVLRLPSSVLRPVTRHPLLRYDATVSDIHASGTLEAIPRRAAARGASSLSRRDRLPGGEARLPAPCWGRSNGRISFRSVDSYRRQECIAPLDVARPGRACRDRARWRQTHRATARGGGWLCWLRLPVQRQLDLRRRAGLLRQQLQYLRQLRSQLHRHRRCLPCLMLLRRGLRRLLRGLLHQQRRLHHDLLQPGRRRLQPLRSDGMCARVDLLPKLRRRCQRRRLPGQLQLELTRRGQRTQRLVS